MNKRFLAIVMAIAMVFALGACVGGNTQKEEEKVEASKSEKKDDEKQSDEDKKQNEGSSTTREKVITVAMQSAWDSLMPLNSNSNYGDFIFDQIYERLVESKSNGDYQAQLAESREANDDSTAVTFKLSKDAKWHDGTPVTADDVVFSMQMFSDPKINAISRYYLAVIAGTDESGAEISENSIAVEALDEYTVKFQMKSAMYPGTLLLNIESVAIIPKHIFESKDPDEINNPKAWEAPIGSGPYKFASKIEGERMEFEANPDYHLGAPKINKMVLRVVPANGLLSALISGEVDLLAGSLAQIPLDDWQMTKEQKNLVFESIPSLNYQTLIINTEKPYMNQNVRQAISMSINREVLVNSLLQGEGVSIVTPIVPSSAYYNPDVRIWYDPD